MKIFMVGHTAQHRPVLASILGDSFPIVELPREAAYSSDHDSKIGREDVIITLNFRRDGDRRPFRLLHVPGAGLDGIDFGSLAESCSVCNVFEHEIPIAEYVLHAMLAAEIRPERMRFTAEDWSNAYRNRIPHGELYGRTLGIIGFGRIGRAIAERARSFGMRIITAARGRALADDTVSALDLPTLLHEADYVVVSCPLTEETRGLIGAAELSMMKTTATLINVSRAEIVREADLFAALQGQKIAGAVLDVWYRYPKDAREQVPPANFPFLDLPNVIATPHSSAWTENLPKRRYGVIADNVRRLAAGEPLVNLVRPPTLARA
jgi:phosphoglycerate dehydrogenase-like enzyme